MAGADIALRVSTAGADEARAKLALVGETGTQALTRINAASSEASGGMEAFSAAIQRTSGAAQQLDDCTASHRQPKSLDCHRITVNLSGHRWCSQRMLNLPPVMLEAGYPPKKI